MGRAVGVFWVGVVAVVFSACSASLSPTAQPSPSAVGSPPLLASPDPRASDPATPPATVSPIPTPAKDLSAFDQRVAEAVAAAQEVPLAGVTSSPSVKPTCEGIGESASEPATRLCQVEFPASEPIVTITASSSGSALLSGWMLVMAEMPDGIEGTTLARPALGDEARVSRSWGGHGCSAVLAVREGTLVVSVRVLLEPGARSVDCSAEAPTVYLETVTRGLLDALAAYPSLGLPVDDLTARDRVVRMIEAGDLQPGERDLISLPSDLANLSDTGEVIAMRDGEDWTILFFENRGVVDHYSGWVYRSSGNLGADEDPLEGGNAIVTRIDDHWFHVVTN